MRSALTGLCSMCLASGLQLLNDGSGERAEEPVRDEVRRAGHLPMGEDPLPVAVEHRDSRRGLHRVR